MTVRFRVEQQLEILTQESDTESNASNPLMLVESKKSHLINTGLWLSSSEIFKFPRYEVTFSL